MLKSHSLFTTDFIWAIQNSRLGLTLITTLKNKITRIYDIIQSLLNNLIVRKCYKNQENNVETTNKIVFKKSAFWTIVIWQNKDKTQMTFFQKWKDCLLWMIKTKKNFITIHIQYMTSISFFIIIHAQT